MDKLALTFVNNSTDFSFYKLTFVRRTVEGFNIFSYRGFKLTACVDSSIIIGEWGKEVSEGTAINLESALRCVDSSLDWDFSLTILSR